MYEQKDFFLLHFRSFFLGTLTVVHRGRQQKSGSRQQKSSRVGQQNNFLIIWPYFIKKNHPKVQQNILLHSSMITPDIGLNYIFYCLKMK